MCFLLFEKCWYNEITMNMEKEIERGLISAFVNSNVESNYEFKPQFLTNDYKKGIKVLTTIEEELNRCDSFSISVAFITMSGIAGLLQTLKELEEKNIHGRILTTDYLMFSEPKALDKLSSFKNIELKMYRTKYSQDGFHTKGYIFKEEEVYKIIIGSSNFTANALTRNKEWNTKLISGEKGDFAQYINSEFDYLFNSDYSLPYSEFIEEYRIQYNIIQTQRKIAKQSDSPSLEQYNLKPNSMQVSFISNLEKIVSDNQNKALLISATGTGKTYASAFAMREMNYKRVLFLVHRNQLALQARQSYEKVFGKTKTMGLVGNGYRDYDSDYVFATRDTLSRDEHLYHYKPNDFDCIILDEAHHSAAQSYQKIMNYFKPELWLGMTATPDKREYGEEKNIYEIFDYQIAYEIRLQQAMEEDLLCPFHYYGISDLKMISDDQSIDFNQLVSEERVKHIIEQANYYGYSGNRVKGLIFCRNIKEADELSKKFNECGYSTLSLNGSHSESQRKEAFERLAMDCESNGLKPLDYIFSVEILNEGVDIVEVNQVIMLRPTQSPIVFIQQLGRGLRKAKGKEYVVILDFIGNYNNNFMIPIALSGDRSYNKDNIRHYVLEGNSTIPGASTIHFDEISRKRIFDAVDQANFSDIKLIRSCYQNLKDKLGRIPELMDFDLYGEIDVLRIFDNNSLGSYYKFLKKYEKDYTIHLNKQEEKMIEFISKKLVSGKRVQELVFLKCLLNQEKNLIHAVKDKVWNEYKIQMNQDQIDTVINLFTNQFPSGSSKKTYMDCIFIEKNNEEYCISKEFKHLLNHKEFYEMIQECLEFGLYRYQKNYINRYKDTDFVLYQKYTYEDVCRLLNWEHNEVPLNIGGYKFDKKTKTFPVFINYEKEEGISATTKYEDHFIDPNTLIAISKSNRNKNSEDIQNFIYAKERGIQVHLFVRINKDDKTSKEFYYLGQMNANGNLKEFIMANTNSSAVEIEWNLDVPVRKDIYEYIVNG